MMLPCVVSQIKLFSINIYFWLKEFKEEQIEEGAQIIMKIKIIIKWLSCPDYSDCQIVLFSLLKLMTILVVMFVRCLDSC